METERAVSLYFEDGTEIFAYPQFADSEPSLLLWLTTDDGDMIQCLNEDAGEFLFLKRGVKLYTRPPMEIMRAGG